MNWLRVSTTLEGSLSGTGGAQYAINFFKRKTGFQKDDKIFRIQVQRKSCVNPVNPIEKSTVLATLLLLVCARLFQPKTAVDTATVTLRSWIALDAPPVGSTSRLIRSCRRCQGWKRDALGNLMLRKGSGSPRRVVACALDRPGFCRHRNH